MGREIVVVRAGRHQHDRWDKLCDDYRRRIERFVPLRERAVKGGSGSGRERLAAEAVLIRKALPSPARIVALDRRGRSRSSSELADWLRRLREDWPHPLVFLLGSDLGLDAELVRQASESLSLGPMTLPHQLARLVLYEQLYRALSIAAGIKYHRRPL